MSLQILVKMHQFSLIFFPPTVNEVKADCVFTGNSSMLFLPKSYKT